MKSSAVLLFVLVVAVFAQWSSDPAVNLLISSGTSEASSPLIVLGPEGDSYVSWAESGSSGWDMRLQRLDLLGNAQWTSGGIIVRESFTPGEIDLYVLTVDQSGAAILAFPVWADSGFVIYAYRISPDGNMLWGADGILLSDTTIAGAESAFPQAAGLASGDVICSWSVIVEPDTAWTVMQKLAPNGDFQWSNGVTVGADSTGLYCWEATLCPTGSDDVILIYTISNHLAWNKRFYAMKWDSNASPTWPGDAVISESRDVLQQCIQPPPHPDGSGGFCMVWQEYDSSGLVTSLVQHVTSGGAIMMDDGGEPVSTMAPRNHTEPYLAIMEDGLETSIFWREMSELQTQNGLYGQRMGENGSLLWTNDGIEYIPLQDMGVGPIVTQSVDNDAAVFYIEDLDVTGNDIAYAMRVDSVGAYVWPSQTVEFSNTACGRGYLSVTPLCWGQQWIAVWSDDSNGTESVYVQNIKLDGTLGTAGLGVGGSGTDPVVFLGEVAPNPFSGAASVSFSLAESGFVMLGLFDLSGRVVSLVADGIYPAGNHSALIDTGDIPSGVYILRLDASGETVSRACVLLR